MENADGSTAGPSRGSVIISQSYVSNRALEDGQEVTVTKKVAYQTYCHPNPLSIRDWKWLDWLCFILFLSLGMYAIGSIATNGEILRFYNSPRTPVKAQPELFHIIVMLFAEIFLLFGVVCGLLYLHFLRNLLGFLLAFIGLLLAAFLLLYLLIYMIYLVSDSDALNESLYHNVKDQISNVGYKYGFFAFQADNQCCGVNSYRDWKTFNPLARLDVRSLPRSCLKEAIKNKKYTWGGLRALERNYDELRAIVNVNGCNSVLLAHYQSLYTSYLFDYLFLLILIIITLVLITILFCRWYETAKLTLRSVRGERAPVRSEADSVTISEYPTAAQTPATTKSMISNNNSAFYAP